MLHRHPRSRSGPLPTSDRIADRPQRFFQMAITAGIVRPFDLNAASPAASRGRMTFLQHITWPITLINPALVSSFCPRTTGSPTGRNIATA